MPDVTGWNPRLLALPLGLVALIGVALPGSAAKVYQYTNSAGETVFTDEPVAGAKVHEVESAPVIPMEPVELPESSPADAPEQTAPETTPSTGAAPSTPDAGAPNQPAPEPTAYQRFEIVEPVDGEVASRPHNSITIALAIEPALQRDDRVFILVDGQPRIQDSSGRRHLINGLASGRHQLIAQIRRDGEVLRESAAVTFSLVTSAQ
ncbi:hypothetical protein LV476_07865 [Guyparkeria hydrothermalis]|uniref:hypothetical protein n=1 Tax=Guyparkeria hydrothermalis TaxID=923 RepID=UPI0020223281|nr:hypothetical protein [Guyparkeria hydrothermalis]MCL7744850.1 hypothetical protein [Guyparkeria hydrothermalis]